MRGHGLPILVKSDLGKDWLTQQFAYVIINGDVQKCGSGIDKNNKKNNNNCEPYSHRIRTKAIVQTLQNQIDLKHRLFDVKIVNCLHPLRKLIIEHYVHQLIL